MTSATLVVPSRGGAQRLPVLFEALRQQTHEEWDAIVVLDGDIDGSVTVVERFAQDLPVQMIVFETNRGRVSALNAGCSAGLGDVLIRCDDDFEPSPLFVAAHVRAHEVKECGVIGLPLNIAPDNPYMRAYGRRADERGRAEAYATPAHERWRLWGGSTSVPRHLFERVGGFDASYRGYGWEDLDFGYRLHLLGVPIEVVRDAEVRHHMASVTTAIRADRAFASGMARHHFEELHGAGSSRGEPGAVGLWQRGTDLAARALTRPRARRCAQLIDSALPVLPAPIGRKAVAFIVESSATAGLRAGYDAD